MKPFTKSKEIESTYRREVTQNVRISGSMKVAMVAALAGIVIFALGGTALATTGQNGPSIPSVADEVSSAQEIQVVTINGSPTGGTFTLTLGSDTTVAIAYNETAANVKTALVDAIAGTASDPSSVSGNAGGPYKVAWPTTAGASGNVAQMTGDGTLLTGGSSPSVTVVTWQNGATTVGGQVSPHGGYSSTTEFCIQCHSVHDGSTYALLAEANVTDTCATCHSLFGEPATGRYNPGLPGKTPGTVSLRSAYDYDATNRAQHQVGATSIPFSDMSGITEAGWAYGGFAYPVSTGTQAPDVPGTSTKWASDEAAGAGTSGAGGGLYCGSCHTPHGEFGQLVNARYYRTDLGAAYDPTATPAGTPYKINEVQTVSLSGLTSGNTWKLSYTDQAKALTTTAAIADTANAAAVQSALEGLAAIGVGNVTVSGAGTTGDPFVVTFNGGALAATNLYPMLGSVQKGSAGSATGSVTVTTTKDGDTIDNTLSTYHVWQEGAPSPMGGTTVAYLHLDSDPAAWESCPLNPQAAGYAVNAVAAAVDTVTTTADGTKSCSYLTTTDSEGQTVSLYGYKLLSAYPNHSWSSGPESWGMGARSHDVARWCGRCHNQALDEMWGGTYHAHPTGCTSCHGNPSDNTSFDFPHTSTFNSFLKSYPDALCISCHTSGSLP